MKSEKKKTTIKYLMLMLVAVLVLSLSACGTEAGNKDGAAGSETAAPEGAKEEDTKGSEEAAGDDQGEDAAEEETGPRDIMILFTSDVHSGVDKGFGYAGLAEIRKNLEDQGFATILVDDGDAVQGEPIGNLTRGEAIIEIMNDLQYDVAIPGNHEFDYTADYFVELTEKANFPYISCNITKDDQLVFDPYIIKEVEGVKIGFVGVTTPKTLIESTPKYFQNEEGEYIYGFMQDETGEKLYSAVQEAVDAVRAEGADYVYVIGHTGLNSEDEPWTYASIIEHTSGIDVYLDGHSHDTEQVVMKDKDGKEVVRSACGTKLAAIGYSRISQEEGILETNIWSWPNDDSAPAIFGIKNKIGDEIDSRMAELDKILDEVVAHTSYRLTINDPKEVDANGNPIRMVRRAETNLGDLCADAVLSATGADIAVVNGGGIRVDIEAGDITHRNIISVSPFGNQICIIEVTGQQLLDALEWGVSGLPDESGGFFQVAGMSYEVDVTIPTPTSSDENGMLTTIEGPRRVSNVMVGDEALDPENTYRLGGYDYNLLNNGSGHTSFNGSPVIAKDITLDSQALIDYVKEDLGGEIPEKYADPYGQGRIVIKD